MKNAQFNFDYYALVIYADDIKIMNKFHHLKRRFLLYINLIRIKLKTFYSNCVNTYKKSSELLQKQLFDN